MKGKNLAVFGVSMLCSCLLLAVRSSPGQSQQGRFVRLAELEIDPAHLDSYKAALRDEIETSIRVEPGVLGPYSVSIKDHPSQIRLFEMYASQAAYEAHLQTSHFKKYKAETAGMVKSLTLLETDPILLGSKFK